MFDPQQSKGKAREDSHWQLGWWELLPLTDGPKRPIVWSCSSVIYTAHPTQPVVIARHFPSSRQFNIPWPDSILHNYTSYDPPTVISVSPTEDWLFAYFPGKVEDGVGCLWKRGSYLDSWSVHECFYYGRHAGVVAAEWLSAERPWTVGEHGAPYRLPPRGPPVPVDGALLVLVIESHQIHLHNVTLRKTITGSLQTQTRSSLNMDSGETAMPQPQQVKNDRTSGRCICTHAAIGVCYNEHLLTVATRSKLMPSAGSREPSVGAIDLSLSLGISSSTTQPDHESATEWERWGDEEVINLCVVAVKVSITTLNLGTRPLPPVNAMKAHLTELRFFSFPPEIIPPSPTITRDPRRPMKSNGMSEPGSLYLAVSYLDFDDFSSLPKSHLSLYSFPPPSEQQIRSCRFEHTRTFDSGILAFLAPGPARLRVIAGFLDFAGIHPRQSGTPKEMRIGSTSILSVPDLKTDPQWDNSPLLCPADGSARDIPVGIAASPNQIYICGLSPSSSVLQGSRVSIQPIPHPSASNQNILTSTPGRHELSRALISSLFSRRAPSDVVRALSASTISTSTLETVLFEAATALEMGANGVLATWYDELLGVLTELYLARSRTEQDEVSQRTFAARWRTAHDMCSVMALNSAFEDCRDGDSYDLDAVWQLVGLSRWLVNLLERLLMRCVYVGDPEISPKPDSTSGSPGKASIDCDVWVAPETSILLHLVHPYAFQNLKDAINHVSRFRDELDPLPPRCESAQIAKDILMDAADSSGVDLKRLLHVLDEIKGQLKYSADEQRRSLVKCSVLPSMVPVVRGAVEKILKASIIDRPKLFLKPSELVDGLTRMSLTERPKDRDIDVVSKGLLLHPGLDVVCMRCGGRSEVSGSGQVAGHVSQSWSAWESTWGSRCICGGRWMRVL